ncbi:hypothetical protein M5689_008682 [Euphorbia peplus]|nr:hypothetical protein M5689_008682 [Euphorbia peplus]
MSSLVILFLLCIILGVQVHSQPNQQAAATFCGKALYKDVCNAVVQSSPAKDKRNLTQKGLNLALSTISEMGKRFSTLKEPNAKKAVEDCTDMYGEATDLLQKSLHALSIGAYHDVNTWVSSAMTSADTCEDAFTETNAKSPITDLNKRFNQYCSTVLAFTNLP